LLKSINTSTGHFLTQPGKVTQIQMGVTFFNRFGD